MAVIGLQFEKVTFERKNPIEGKINVNNNVRVTSVEESKLGKRDALKFGFEFTVDYEPKIANMKWEGAATVVAKPEVLKEEIAQWKKEKKVSNELMTQVLNHVLAKSNIAAMTLAREVNLPPPLQLPKVQVK